MIPQRDGDVVLEKNIEQKSRRLVERSGGWLVKLTWINGIPDRLVLAPPGIIYFVEFKKPGVKARPLQSARIRRIKRMGFQAYVVDNYAEFVLLFERFQSHANEWNI